MKGMGEREICGEAKSSLLNGDVGCFSDTVYIEKWLSLGQQGLNELYPLKEMDIRRTWFICVCIGSRVA